MPPTTKNVPTIAYLAPSRAKARAELSKATRIPRAALIREAVDMLLAKYKKSTKGGAR